MKLLLFDIDMTLISTGGAGRDAMITAFAHLTGHSDGMHKVRFSGRTDPAILRDALEVSGMEWRLDLQDKFRVAYLEELVLEMKKPRTGMQIMPGILQALTALKKREDITLALLTGNWREGGRIKLEHFNLFHFFEFGAFSDYAWVRNELPAVAARLLQEQKDIVIEPQDVFVIGDTPHDVACTQPFGARSVAVATGNFSLAQLEEAKPDYLFEDLSGTEAFLKIFA